MNSSPQPYPPYPAGPPPAPQRGSQRVIITILIAIGGLLIILPVLGIVAAVAIPMFIKATGGGSQAEEAHHNIDMIAAGAESTFAWGLDGGLGNFRFPPSVDWTPAREPCRQYLPDANDWGHPTWRAVGFRLSKPDWYRYRFTSSGGGAAATYTVEAEGDVNCNGVKSHFVHTGRIVDGKVVRDDLRSERPDE